MAVRPWGLSFVIVDAAFLILFGFLYPKLWVKNWFLALCSLGLSAFFYLRSFEVDRFVTLVTIIIVNSVLVLQTVAESWGLTLKQVITTPLIYVTRTFPSLFYLAVNVLDFAKSRSGKTVGWFNFWGVFDVSVWAFVSGGRSGVCKIYR